MNKLFSISLILCVWFLSANFTLTYAQEADEKEEPAVSGPTSTDETAAKIIALNLKARGGLTAIKNITSMKMTGTYKDNKDTFDMVWYWKAPNKYREEKQYTHLGYTYKTIMAYDGKTAWTQEILPKEKLPVMMDKKQMKDFILKSDLLGPFVDWETKGNNFAYRGEIKLNNKPVYLIEGQIKDGTVLWYYIDSVHFLVLRVGFEDQFASSKVDADYYIKKFCKSHEVTFEKEKVYYVGKQNYKTISYDTMNANTFLSDTLFSLPVKKEIILRQK